MILRLMLIGLLATIGCPMQRMRDSKIELIDSFTREVKGSSIEENEVIVSKYFAFSGNHDQTELRYEYLNLLRNQVEPDFVIHTYSEAEYKFVNIFSINDTTVKGSVYVIKLNKLPEYAYIKVINDKIESICPLVKGKMIVGWL